MSREKQAEHTLLPFTAQELLPPLQKRVLLYLAESDPQTINETVKALKGNYKSTWLAFNSLEKNRLIQKVTLKWYRGREYPQFWLTEGGVFVALCEEASTAALFEKSAGIYPENKVLHCLLEISPILSTEGFRALCFSFFRNGKLEQSDIDMLIASQMQHKLTVEEAKQLVEIMKKYPEQYKRFSEDMKQLQNNVEKIALLFE